MPDEVISQIIERTDGVPLFIEELTKSVLESGLLREEPGHYLWAAFAGACHSDELPRLADGAARSLGTGAACGADWCGIRALVPLYPLHAVSGLSEDELQAALNRLVASELVFQTGTPPDAVYTFKHALVQETAYGSLLRNTRQQLHGRIAEAIEAHFPELIDSQPELFARHYTEAGLIEKSVSYWSKAAERSVARSAMAEAIAQFQKALDQMTLLPDDFARQRQELELRSSLGIVLQSVKGYAAPENGTKRSAPPENCGSSLVLHRSFFGFPMRSRSITRSAAN